MESMTLPLWDFNDKEVLKTAAPGGPGRLVDFNITTYCKECDLFYLKEYKNHIHIKERYEEYLKFIKQGHSI